jgi:hypothetical protein
VGARGSVGILVTPRATKTTAQEEHEHGEEQGSPGTPGEPKRRRADFGSTAFTVKAVTSLDEDGTVKRLAMPRVIYHGNLRHQWSGNAHEEERGADDQARQARCETAAGSQKCGEEPENGEYE